MVPFYLTTDAVTSSPKVRRSAWYRSTLLPTHLVARLEAVLEEQHLPAVVGHPIVVVEELVLFRVRLGVRLGLRLRLRARVRARVRARTRARARARGEVSPPDYRPPGSPCARLSAGDSPDATPPPG